MRRLTMVAVLAAMLPAAPAIARDAVDVVPVGGDYAGRSYPEWSAAWQRWAIVQPAAHHPLSGPIDDAGTEDPLARCRQGQSGPVWFLGGVLVTGADVDDPFTVNRRCRVPGRTALYFPVANAECSSIEAPPFFGADERARRLCAAALTDGYDVGSLSATVDGGPAVRDLRKQRVQSPDFKFKLPRCPAANVLGVDCALRRGRSADDGYYLLLRPLRPGRHVIEFSATHAFGFSLHITYELHVG